MLLVPAFAATAAAATTDTLDQSQPLAATQFADPAFPGSPSAQIFTAGLTGLLDEVRVYVSGPPGTLADVSIQGVTTYTYPYVGSTLAPDGDVMADAIVSVPSVANWVDVNFNTPAPVTAGTQYAIEIAAPAGATGSIGIWGVSPGTYSGGQAVHDGGEQWYSANGDWAFQTFVQQPVTTGTLALAVTGVPAGTADVTVSGAETTDTATGSGSLTLSAGTYAVTAADVTVDGLGYTATVTGSPATVTAGDITNVLVAYALAATYANLETLVGRGEGQVGIARSLMAKLQAAQAAAARGDESAVSGALGAFVNEVAAQTGKSLTVDQAATLAALAQALTP